MTSAGIAPEARMANDIARQFGHLDAGDAAARIADHIGRFWDPRMRANLAHTLAHEPDSLDPLVRAAARSL